MLLLVAGPEGASGASCKDGGEAERALKEPERGAAASLAEVGQSQRREGAPSPAGPSCSHPPLCVPPAGQQRCRNQGDAKPVWMHERPQIPIISNRNLVS
ncbi:unnamed protein product [Natator depressus]